MKSLIAAMSGEISAMSIDATDGMSATAAAVTPTP
jgi:hypothetical protein